MCKIHRHFSHHWLIGDCPSSCIKHVWTCGTSALFLCSPWLKVTSSSWNFPDLIWSNELCILLIGEWITRVFEKFNHYSWFQLFLSDKDKKMTTKFMIWSTSLILEIWNSLFIRVPCVCCGLILSGNIHSHFWKHVYKA